MVLRLKALLACSVVAAARVRLNHQSSIALCKRGLLCTYHVLCDERIGLGIACEIRCQVHRVELLHALHAVRMESDQAN
jgi:hypothetical protein